MSDRAFTSDNPASLQDLTIPALHWLDWKIRTRLGHGKIIKSARHLLNHDSTTVSDVVEKCIEAQREFDEELFERYLPTTSRKRIKVLTLFPEEARELREALQNLSSFQQLTLNEDALARLRQSAQTVIKVHERLCSKISGMRLSISDLFNYLYDERKTMLSAWGIGLLYSPPESRGIIVNDGGSALKKAFLELLDNAITHAFTNQTYSQKIINLQFEQKLDEETLEHLRVLIIDHGTGIPPEKLDQEGLPRTRGRGLLDAFRTIKNHCGTYIFKSVQGEGTTAGGDFLNVCLTEAERIEQDSKTPTTSRATPKRKQNQTERIEQDSKTPTTPILRRLALPLLFLALVATGSVYLHRLSSCREHPRTTLLVAPDGSSPFRSISSAVASAEPGAEIVLVPAEYTETLTLEKPLTIVGSAKGTVTLRATRSHAVLSSSDNLTLKNLRIILDSTIKLAAVAVRAGKLTILNCEISSRGASCVEVASGKVIIRNSLIHHTPASGVFIHGDGHAEVFSTTIQFCQRAGITLADRADGTFKDNTISHCKKAGIYIYGSAKGIFQRNDVSYSSGIGVAVLDYAHPEFHLCTIHDNELDGVLVLGGKPTFEQNHIYANLQNGLVIGSGASPRILRNTIAGNACNGVIAMAGASGEVRDNKFQSNAASPMMSSKSATTQFANNTIRR